MSKKLATLSLVFVTLFSLFCFYNLRYITFDYNFESFFPVDDPDLDFYLTYRDEFENDNDYLLVALESKESIFNASFLSRADELSKELEKLSNVNSVLSATNTSRFVISPIGAIEIPLIHIGKPDLYQSDSTKIFNDSLVVKRLISEDAKSIAILIKHKNKISKQDGDELSKAVLNLAEKFNFYKIHIAGKIHAQGVFIDKMQYELGLFISASLILTVVFLLIIYRSLWELIVPLLTVFLSAVWITGVIGFLGKPLDVLMVMLPTIIFVVTMSDVIHILTKYIEELRLGADRLVALKTTLKEVGLATFLTSFTTAIGFFSLMTSSIKPIRDLGFFTGLGVLLAFILAFSFLPASLYFRKRVPNIVLKDNYRKKWRSFLGNLLMSVFRNRVKILFSFFVLLTASIWGVSKLEINSHLIEDLSNNDPLKKSFIFFDETFGGSRPFELAIWAKDSTQNILDIEPLREIQKIESYLINEYNVSNIISPNFIIKGINQSVNGGLSKDFTLPDTELKQNKVKKQLRRFEEKINELNIISKDRKTGRISGRMGDIGSKLTQEKNQELIKFLEANIDSSIVGYQLTGTSLLIDKNNESLVSNTLEGLAIAFLVVAIIVGLMFRSLRMVIITLIPNIIPLLFVAAIMGFAGINLKLSTSIIFTIAFGIAVDDSIHFISKLKLELRKGKSLLYAIKRTYFSTGKALIVTTAVLSSGFLMLVFSSFGGTFYTGLMVGLTLLFALASDLILLPVLLLLFAKRKKSKS